MIGWQPVGRVKRTTRDFDLWLVGSEQIRKDDVLRFSAYEDGPLRAGQVQVVGLLASGVATDCTTDAAIPALCDGDYVFRATAIGEHAFRPRAARPQN